jgi:hypothetical protein
MIARPAKRCGSRNSHSITDLQVSHPRVRGRDIARQTSRRGRKEVAALLSVGEFGAQKRTRTFTSLRTLAPEASASTNFTIWATGEESYPMALLRSRHDAEGASQHVSNV